ncbi:MAG: hypothetical protein JSS83_28765 [Cyanobacteria bacterium SZAS LIN-3]|jgi:hypothetical protein|nr:hypothetical protein [Cyanobacteria bacterium SZAS LIN-3]
MLRATKSSGVHCSPCERAALAEERRQTRTREAQAARSLRVQQARLDAAEDHLNFMAELAQKSLQLGERTARLSQQYQRLAPRVAPLLPPPAAAPSPTPRVEELGGTATGMEVALA